MGVLLATTGGKQIGVAAGFLAALLLVLVWTRGAPQVRVSPLPVAGAGAARLPTHNAPLEVDRDTVVVEEPEADHSQRSPWLIPAKRLQLQFVDPQERPIPKCQVRFCPTDIHIPLQESIPDFARANSSPVYADKLGLLEVKVTSEWSVLVAEHGHLRHVGLIRGSDVVEGTIEQVALIPVSLIQVRAVDAQGLPISGLPIALSAHTGEGWTRREVVGTTNRSWAYPHTLDLSAIIARLWGDGSNIQAVRIGMQVLGESLTWHEIQPQAGIRTVEFHPQSACGTLQLLALDSRGHGMPAGVYCGLRRRHSPDSITWTRTQDGVASFEGVPLDAEDLEYSFYGSEEWLPVRAGGVVDGTRTGVASVSTSVCCVRGRVEDSGLLGMPRKHVRATLTASAKGAHSPHVVSASIAQDGEFVLITPRNWVGRDWSSLVLTLAGEEAEITVDLTHMCPLREGVRYLQTLLRD